MFSARVDCLSKREITSNDMTEHFEGRPDFLYYRHVTYEKVPKKHNAASGKGPSQNPILSIVEKFHPNPGLPANSDVAERCFMLAENLIKVVYQLEEGRITASTIEFKTPITVTDQSTILTYNPEEVHTYQVSIHLLADMNEL